MISEQTSFIRNPRSRLSLSPHRLLPLETGSVALLAESSTGWCLINPSGYQTLREYLGGNGRSAGGVQASVHPLLKQLWESGLLLVDGAPHPHSLPLGPKPISSLLLKLTGACNFRCAYCYDYEPGRFTATLELDRIRETLTFLLARSRALSLVFHGGEPLLRFDLIKKIVELAQQLAQDPARLRFSMQTNGSLFTPEIVEFLEVHRFSVGISLDGNDEGSNRLRSYRNGKGTLARIKGFLATYSDFVQRNCGFLAVASRASAPALPDFALWLQDQGFGGLNVSFLDLAGLGQNLKAEKLVPEEAAALYAKLVEMVRHGMIQALALRNLLSRIDNLFTFQPGDFCHKGPCAASDEFLVLDAAGALRSCDCIYDPYFLLAGNTQEMPAITDHPARDAIVARHAWLRRHGRRCQGCPLFGLCGGTCVAKAMANNGAPHSVDPLECAIKRYLYPELLREIDGPGEKPLLAYYHRHKFLASKGSA